MKFPAIRGFQSYNDYFRALLSANKDAGRAFSLRLLARRLKWPSSYISDLLAGRKQLSLSRALQFARFARFDIFDTERLLILALKEEVDPHVRAFYEEKIKREQDSRRTLKSPVEPALFEQVHLLAVYEVVRWAKRLLTPATICRLLYTISGLDEPAVAAMLQKVQDLGWVKFRDDGNIAGQASDILLDEIQANGDSSEVHRKYAESFLQFCKSTSGPAAFSSGFIELPRARFPEIAEKLTMTRNWLFALSKETAALSKSELADTLPFQFDLNLFPIIQREVAAEIFGNGKQK